jgi:hypothetical protein
MIFKLNISKMKTYKHTCKSKYKVTTERKPLLSSSIHGVEWANWYILTRTLLLQVQWFFFFGEIGFKLN